MTPRITDFSRSRAVLIGVSEYQNSTFTPIPAAFNNVASLKRMLADPMVSGWPHDRISVVFNPMYPGSLATTLDELAQAADDVLLIYYIGHGKLDNKAQLCLTVSTTHPARPLYTGFPYEWMAEVMRASPARVKLTILDCCFAGRAIDVLGDQDSAFADLTAVEGVYTLAATTRNRTAHTPTVALQHNGYTSFTGEFLRLLESGIPGGPGDLTLETIYLHLKRRMAQLGLPEPTQRGTDTATRYVFARNAAVSNEHSSSTPSPDTSGGVANSASPGTAREADDHLIGLIAQVIQSLPADMGERISRLPNGGGADNAELDRSWLGSRDIDEGELSLAEVLGAGGQGQVVRVNGPVSGLVYKSYHRPGHDILRLRRLLDLRANMPPWSRQYLDRHAAWPLNVVLKNGTPNGFLMRDIPSRYRGITKAGPRLRELQYLLYEPKPTWGDIASPGIENRLEIALQVATLIQFLHDHEVIIGDLSMVNILWCPGEPPGIFLIDCDGARPVGYRGTSPTIDTPGWADPDIGTAGPDMESDRYKLALAVGRVLSRDPAVVPGQSLSLLPGILDDKATRIQSLWSEAALQREDRPSAESWADALAGRVAATKAQPHTQTPAQVLPFYFVCDESQSMVGAPIDALNASLPNMQAEIGSNPVVADHIRFCLIGFSDDAEVLIPLADLSNLTTMPTLRPSGQASYSTAFELLYETINRDVTNLRNSGSAVYRPAIFFLAGGPSRDDWSASLQRLTDPSWLSHPNIFAFGFGTARKDDMAVIGTTGAFTNDDTSSVTDVMREYATSLIRSVINSVSSMGSNISLTMPDTIPGFTNIDTDWI